MEPEALARMACDQIHPGSDRVAWHLNYLEKMVAIDSRSFNVNEFEGDRKTPSDMREILQCAEDYLKKIGFPFIKINTPPPNPPGATPILMAEIPVSPKKPTILFYAHLDKQPYMDDGRFLKWSGVPPTVLRWNENHTRAYGRGAADDLSGVIAIGLTVDTLLRSVGYNPNEKSPDKLRGLPCNLKVIYETEEECGSHSLIAQIRQNAAFFAGTDCVIITDVVNPATGVPGLTTSLRGIVQMEVEVKAANPEAPVDPQTALYKLLASLIREDHSLAVKEIADADCPVTEEERKGYAGVPTTIEQLRETAGLLRETRLTVPETVESVLIAQLRKSYANARPGHRVSGSIIFGAAGTRLSIEPCNDVERTLNLLKDTLSQWNPFNLKLMLRPVPSPPGTGVFDVILQSAVKDPHSGINGGPVPVPELQIARMVDKIVQDNGSPTPEIARINNPEGAPLRIRTQSLHVDHDGNARPFDESTAKAIVEIRLAPGNEESRAEKALRAHLERHLLPGFELKANSEKGADPWMTQITHPIFSIVLSALEKGYEQKSCLYGCGGSIPFVAKLLSALGPVQPICLGAYDPDARMHEPGESMSLVDLLGCSRSMVHIVTQAFRAFPPSQNH